MTTRTAGHTMNPDHVNTTPEIWFRCDVVTGRIEAETGDWDDQDPRWGYLTAGKWLNTATEVAPWGVDETSMTRATNAVRDNLGLVVGEWDARPHIDEQILFAKVIGYVREFQAEQVPVMTWEDLDALKLPEHTHATILVTGSEWPGETRRGLVWADRAYTYCPQCSEPVDRGLGCPAELHGGWIIDTEVLHDCGELLDVTWEECDPTPEGFQAAAATVATAYQAEVARGRAAITARLRTELELALGRYAKLVADDSLRGSAFQDRVYKIITGDRVTPGVMYDEDGEWCAWDYDPAGNGEDEIVVRESDLKS